jgi:uncharacterized protein YkwD
MVFSPREISIALSAGVMIALPGSLLLGAHTFAPHSRQVALRTLPSEPAHDWYTMPRHAPVVPTPTPAAAPAPVPVAAAPAPAPAAPVAVRPAPPPPPRPVIVIGSRQQALINADRAASGLGPLTWSPCLAAVAAQNARRMAAQGFISHANGVQLDLGCRLGYRAGENVGYTSSGINDAQLNTLFMNSPEHRANILGPYRFVGTAWAVAANGYAYIAVEFG